MTAQQAPAPAPAPGGRQGTPPAAGGAGGGGGAQNRGGFTQFTRPLASADVIARGKALYDANCASCHAPDLRGGPRGTNLQRSGVALNDQKGERISTAIAGHSPTITLVSADSVAVAEYIHSVLAMAGGSGSPSSGRTPGVAIDVLVGDAKAGEAQFSKMCSSCHSVTGDMKGIAAKFADARALQNGWVSGSSGRFGGGGRGGSNAGTPATVTMADGSELRGTIVRLTDFLVVLTLPDGTRRSMARNDGVPKVTLADRLPHRAMLTELAFNDPDNKRMHDLTAYLWTLK